LQKTLLTKASIMRIVHVVEPFASGIAVFVKSLVENLSDDMHIIVHGERDYVMKFADVIKHFPKNNVRFIRWKSAQREISITKDTAAFMELYTILSRLKKKNLVDAVHLHSSKSGFLGRLACKMAGISKVVYTPNGAPFLVGKNDLTNYLYKQLEKLGSSFGGKVVCCSESELEAYRKLGINAININNGISLLTTSDQKNTQSTGNAFRVVTSGRIINQKNPAMFNTIARYFEEFGQFEFVWVGDGNDDAKSKLTAKNIRVTGWLNKEEAAEKVTDADIYLSTANFEGLPFAVLEALAMRKPVLLTDCIGNRDIVKKGMNGDLFKNEHDAIIKILLYFNNMDMLQVMGAHSANICAEEFNSNSTSLRYLHLYKS
jgi:glycosyltransferase involved in cell wall biosynthesis